MTDRLANELDAALAELAADVAERTPRPGTDLTARVLADAAAVVAAAHPPEERARPTAPAAFSLRDLFFGWTAGATAAAALALVIGISIGMKMDSVDLPMMTAEEGEPELFVADAGFLPEDFN